MTENLTITTEQINDVPLLLGIIEQMGIRETIDAHVEPHGAWQGISVGTAVSIWLCYLLGERDHCLVNVREWVKARQETFNALLDIKLRETDMTDDRLANVLKMVGDNETQARLDSAMLGDWISVYQLPTKTIRLDSTSVSVYHDTEIESESLLQPGHSKDHRPDLAQFKLMLSSLDPLGIPLTGLVVSGNRADDGLYIPAYEASIQVLGQRAVLVVGDSKMAALATRAYLATGGSCYLCAYRPPRATLEIHKWIENALQHAENWQVIRQIDEKTGEIKPVAVIDEWQRSQTALHPLPQEPFSWTERVLVVRSEAMRQGVAHRREKALDAMLEQLQKLCLPPQRGRKRYPSRDDLRTYIDHLLEQRHLKGLLHVTLVQETLPDGSIRWIPGAYFIHQAAWQAMVDRLGWQIYVSNTTQEQYDAPTLVWNYRYQVTHERGFSRLKTRNLRIRPVFLRDEQRLLGLTWLLCLALRVLTLTEYRLRTALAVQGESLVGLNPVYPAQKTASPTTEYILKGFQHITLTLIQLPDQVICHVSSLTHVQHQILTLLQLPTNLYSQLTGVEPNLLEHLREP